MSLMIHNVSADGVLDANWYTPAELDEHDIRDIPNCVDEVWYWYGTGCYEGTGEMIMRRGNTYAHHHLGHCSCYGPTDNIPDEPKWAYLKELRESFDDRYLPDVEPVLVAAERGAPC